MLPATCLAAAEKAPTKVTAIKLNTEAFGIAQTLIAQGRFVADKKGAWSSDHPTRSQESHFARDHGFQEYGNWFLAIDEGHAPNTKARFKFPFGDFRNVHRCGLLAIKARAHEYGYHEIEVAAARLLNLIDSAGPRSQKRVD